MISAHTRSATTHRGGTHWLATCLALTGGIYLIWQEFAIWFFIGYASHLALDMMTISGLKVGAGRHARAGAILITNILFAAQVHEISHRCVARDGLSFFPQGFAVRSVLDCCRVVVCMAGDTDTNKIATLMRTTVRLIEFNSDLIL